MKVNCTKPITALNGEPIKQGEETATIGLTLSNMILEPGCKLHPVKAYELAKKLYNNKTVEIEEEDVEVIKTAVESSNYLPIAKAQVLEALS